MATAAEVERWKAMCRMLTSHNDRIRNQRDEAIRQQLAAEDARKTAQAVADGLEWQVQELEKENSELRKLASEAIHLMRNESPDCGICKHYHECWTGEAMDYSPGGCIICNRAKELRIEGAD